MGHKKISKCLQKWGKKEGNPTVDDIAKIEKKNLPKITFVDIGIWSKLSIASGQNNMGQLVHDPSCVVKRTQSNQTNNPPRIIWRSSSC